ncbi:MAG: hypothetical protein WC805_03735 [Patescibacteria group bacterium]|jgi:hypothetical protein
MSRLKGSRPSQKKNKPISKIRTDKIVWWFSGLILLLVTVVLMRPPTDPDLGWHLRNGADILRLGVPRGDLYSYTMFGYPWISHEWLTDVGLYLSNHYLGFWWLSALFAGLVAAAYLLAARVSKARWEVVIFMTLVAALVALPIVGIRAQVITLVGLAATLYYLFSWYYEPKNHRIYWLIPLMLIWVNLHGGFVAGLLLSGVFLFLATSKTIWQHYSKKALIGPILTTRQLIELGIVIVLMAGVTLINPYTWRVYDEIIRTVFNPAVLKGISEWNPVQWSNPQSQNLIIYTVCLLVLLPWTWRKLDVVKLGLALVFFVIAIASWRNLPFFPLIALPLLVEMIDQLFPKGIHYYLRSRWLILALMPIIIYIGYLRYQEIMPYTHDPSAWGSIANYPYQAVQYIKENHPAGKLFNEYNWGGYLVWQLPEKQVFIDGRMAVWQTPEQDIFADYLVVGKNQEATPEILGRYDVGLALVFANRTSKDYFMAHPEEWKLLYSDKIAMIFERSDLKSITN